jgi:UDP-3-O-[3-hydroxymyristoyl] N-acetylglucosamine deacetylase
MQTTIRTPVSCYGLGVHSGKRTQLTLKPSYTTNSGIVFVRTDVTDVSNVIQVSYKNVSDTTLSTSVSNNANVKVSTIEHLMAALWGCGIDNVIIELDGEEVPIMDGSSRPFVFLLECAGLAVLNEKRCFLKILKEVTVNQGESYITTAPSENLVVNMVIDFPSKAIGYQEMSFSDTRDDFKESISGARTFGFVHELEYLKNKGLARGASLDNAIGIDNDQILNEDGLRFDNECVRHKLLDSLGDFFTSGRIIGALNCYKTGHHLNNFLLRKIFEDPNAYCFVAS